MTRRKGRKAWERIASLMSSPGDPNALKKTDSMCLNPCLLRVSLPELPVPSASPGHTPLAWITLFRRRTSVSPSWDLSYTFPFPMFDGHL